jgi:competence protein ComEA
MKLIQAIFVSIFLAFASLAVQAAPVDINSADAKTIAKVMKGVGIKKAEAIVAYRNKHGKFRSLEDLVKVKGIGKSTVAKNRQNLSLGKAK